MFMIKQTGIDKMYMFGKLFMDRLRCYVTSVWTIYNSLIGCAFVPI